jgi:hypothetical protein
VVVVIIFNRVVKIFIFNFACSLFEDEKNCLRRRRNASDECLRVHTLRENNPRAEYFVFKKYTTKIYI